MIPIIYVYTEFYHDAKKLLRSLQTPYMSKVTYCTEESWESGKCFEVETEAELWRIFKR